jgi:elongation factor Ts
MEISANLVKDLRAKTGAGMMDCKAALQEAAGNFEKAVELLRIKGMASAAKKSSREAKEGTVTSYIHNEGRLGVLLEINCETDFVARTDKFKGFVKDVAMHIAAAGPRWLRSEEVPLDLIEAEKKIAFEQHQSKPAQALEKIVQGKVNKFFEDNCLLHQTFVKDSSKTIEQFLQETIATVGENITIRRFVRFVLGEGL